MQMPQKGCPGQWANGKWIFEDKASYDGEWKDGWMHGQGVYTYQSGARYEGEVSKNKPHGKGSFFFRDGDLHAPPQGDGSKRSVYEGDWRFGQRHGRGKITFSNGTVYKGEFDSDHMHGQFTIAYAADGRPADPSLDYSWSAGDKLDCLIKKNTRHGACTYTFFNGETIVCRWVDGHCPEFSARQRLVLDRPDKASSRARAAGYVSVEEWDAAKVQTASVSALVGAQNSMAQAVSFTSMVHLFGCICSTMCVHFSR